MELVIRPHLPNHPEYAVDIIDVEVAEDAVSIDAKHDGSVEVQWFVDCAEGNKSIYVGDLDYMIEFLIAARQAARDHFNNQKWPNG